MSYNADEAVKPKLSPKELGIIVLVIAAVAVAISVIWKTVSANQVHDVIVIHGATSAKPKIDPKTGRPFGYAAEPLGGASDKVFMVGK